MAVLVDAEKRARALDPAVRFHLTAPAGSGKTFLLVARFLRLLGIVGHPGQVLALTFTNKAAAEMRERIRGCLDRAKRGARTEEPAEAELLEYASKALAVHKKLEDLLLAGEILQIRTFHSFCYAIASRAPFEAGITPGSTLMDENEQEFFLHEVVSEALEQIASRKESDAARDALMNRLLYLNNSWRSLVIEMRELVERRGALGDLVEALSRDRASGCLAQRVRELVEAELKGIRAGFEACELGRGWSGFIEQGREAGAEAVRALPTRIPGARWEDLPQWVCLAETFLTREGGIRSRFGPKTGFYEGFAKTMWGCAIQNIPVQVAQKLHEVRQLPVHDAPVTDPDTLWDLVVLLNSILEIYDSKLRAKRALDYSAIELAALRLFDAADPSDLQLTLDQQIRHILVDEFQDTSREQWRLLHKLCSGWSDGDGRTLFVVGDPKQSIYAFRKAEVRLFMEAGLGLPIEGGGSLSMEPVTLDTNFRSKPELIDWCNRLFGNTVMADPKLEFDEVPFSPAKCGIGCQASDAGVPIDDTRYPTHDTRYPPPDVRYPPVELALFMEWPDGGSARKREAQWLARRLALRLAQHGPCSQTAILLFSRTHLPVYLEALQQEKVPVQVKEGLKIEERPEVFYLWQLCRGIVMPHDDIAWAAQLRSPWFSLDFDRIYAISREGPPLWVEKIEAFSERDEQAGRLRQALTGAWRHVGHLPLADVVESAWLELEGARAVASRWGSRGLNCCRRFLQLLREAELGEPVRTLARLEQLLPRTYEPVDPDTAHSNIVLSTVHGAKGLEFDVVFIPFMDWNPESRRKELPPPYILERSPCSGDYLLASRPDRLRGEKDPLYARLRKLRSRRHLGEARRLFYVAVTRARHELVMSGLVRKRANSFSSSGESPLGWLDKHYGIDELCGIERVLRPEQTGGPAAGAGPAIESGAGFAGDLQAEYGIYRGAIPRCVGPLPQEAQLLEWRRSARARDGMRVDLEPAGGADDHVRDGRWKPDGNEVPVGGHGRAGVLPEALERSCEVSAPELAPAQFERERPVFTVVSPSGLRVFGSAHESASLFFKGGWGDNWEVGEAGEQADRGPAACPPNVWGTLVHRLLADFGKTGSLPSDKRVSAVLSRIGSPKSLEIARQALSEVKSCLNDPWLQTFYSIPPEHRRIEWSAECAHEGDVLYSGVIDLAAEIDGKWLLVDFKTSRPLEGEDVGDFLLREVEAYRPQILAYCEIWAKLAKTDPAHIEAFIYWTALRERRAILVEIGR
ncbi:MAG TPA: UvrD-helicase domain-containing protein [Syntrophobacteraceae bacterium]|nr:UvrD-helicase domain-containing protein [Syntrophobacteraceae bacterium]